MTRYKVDFKSIMWEQPMAGVRSKTYEQGGRKLRLVEFTRDFVEPDWCKKGHIGYVLQGRLEVNFDGKVVVFGLGDGVFIPAGEEHKHKGTAVTEAVKVVLVEDV
ncbi:MAG TPA: cupin domain-containing protein [Sedimentisphaerales bacterium]|nr:cupin domain-containing protein [Sedimentisphaerales bacterium]